VGAAPRRRQHDDRALEADDPAAQAQQAAPAAAGYLRSSISRRAAFVESLVDHMGGRADDSHPQGHRHRASNIYIDRAPRRRPGGKGDRLYSQGPWKPGPCRARATSCRSRRRQALSAPASAGRQCALPEDLRQAVSDRLDEKAGARRSCQGLSTGQDHPSRAGCPARGVLDHGLSET